MNTETLIISRVDDGFRVYSPANPNNSYIVSGSPEAPSCSCPDFQHAGSVNWHCKHIQGVIEQFGGSVPHAGRSYEEEERLAIQNENAPAPQNLPYTASGISQMLLKRSVSPDGRIDSLSVEFSCSVEKATEGEIKSQARQALAIQTEIVNIFLGKPAKTESEKRIPDGSMPAKLLSIAGMNTKWGRRLFINVRANGDSLKLFGSSKQLSEAITAAGYPDLAKRIDEQMELNIPCRITTRQSEDGRYVNVDRVFPPNGGNGQHRGRL